MFSAHFSVLFFFFFNDTATTEIYTLSLHDALPICMASLTIISWRDIPAQVVVRRGRETAKVRSEEHTSELQSRSDLVCRLLLEKKKQEDQVVGGAISGAGGCDVQEHSEQPLIGLRP